MDEVRRWLLERPTSLLWVSGPASCGKTTAVEAEIRRAAVHADVLWLSALWPDDAFAELKTAGQRERLTTKLLLRFAEEGRILVLDGLDTLQQSTGQNANDVTDCRLRQLLLAACEHALSTAAIIVTSRLGPPALLPADSFTVVDRPETSAREVVSLPESGSVERRVLEFAALSRRAIDSAAIERMSGIEERVTERALSSLSNAGVVTRVNEASYQVPDWIRSSVFPEATRTDAVREVAIEALQQDGSDPERLLDLLVDHGNFDEAVNVYWHSLGNFAQLHDDGRDHFGIQICRRLNDGLGAGEVSPYLRGSEGVFAVMNDWSQFASCCGDAVMSALAAETAYQVLPENQPRWNAAILAAHVGQANLMTGNLPAAMEWSERSWNHARQGMRETEGIAVRETMDAYDWSANTMAQVYLRLNQPAEIRRLLDDLTAIHEHGRQSLAEFNAGSIIPLDGPSGEVRPEQMAGGRLAAMLALLEERFDEVRSFAARADGTLAARQLRTLLLRAEISAKCDEQADALLSSLRDSAQQRDDCAAECELAVWAQLRLEDPTERLALAESYLPRAAACGLGIHWRDLQLARARALETLGRRQDACRAAEAALFSTAGVIGAYEHRDWVAVREAVDLLESFGEKAPDFVLAHLERSPLPERRSPRKPDKRRPAPSSAEGAVAREERHAAALKVVEAFENEGMPFVLYFRKFDFEVLHGPFEFGPKLTENALRDALPPEVEVITIQDHGQMTYKYRSSRLQREAPALLLPDETWQEAARALIPIADLIVSEPLMLTEGVRLELQMIYDAHRWDRTVLLLPPFNSYLSTIDNDSLIQMFPRCIWADSLHHEHFTDSPVIKDLLERIRVIARLPLETRRTLRDLAMRDKAYPIDLIPIAQHFETTARLGSVFNEKDETTRYYAFWQMFRAVGIRGVRYNEGDKSSTNRCEWAHSYLEMSKIMCDHSKEGEKVILQGDPAEAQLLVQSAYGLIQDLEDDMLVRVLRAEAEEQWESLLRLEQVMKEKPDRFEIRPRYGPLIKKKLKQSDNRTEA
ncbi:MAG TPA: hypothetical protein VF290_27850 [Pyrinomonadaceae bacterium]